MTTGVRTTTPKVAETTVDGVRVLWVEAPPPAHAVLRFRVGRVDETLARSGIGHLAEHLACADLGERPYPYNASVHGVETLFYATGEPDDLVDFLARACAALTDLDTERLVLERRILRTEAAGKSAGLMGMHASLRYGTRGPGLLGHDEIGLNRVEEHDVAAYVERFHTADNAVVTLTCPPPADLRLPLRRGEHRPAPDAEPLGYTFPAWTRLDVSTVSMSFVHRRSVATSTALAMAERRVFNRLRTGAGISYGATCRGEPVSADHVLSVLSSDLLARHEQQATDLFLATVEDIAAHGFRPDELQRERALWATVRSSPEHVLGELNRRAFETLVGREADDPWESLDGLDVDEASSAFADLLRDSLFVAPAGVAVTSDATPLPEWSDAAVTGTPLRRLTAHPIADAPDARVVVGIDGVTLRLDDERLVTVRWAECTAAMHDNSGRWLLYGADGFRVVFDPSEWVCGQYLADALEQKVAEHVRVPATVDEPGVPEPEGAAGAPMRGRPRPPHIPWWRAPNLSTWILVLMAVPLSWMGTVCSVVALFPDDGVTRLPPAIATVLFGVPAAWLWHEVVRRAYDPLPPPAGPHLFD